MARIQLSMSGEGRGHATRVRAVVEALKPEHEITIHAAGDAHDLLAPLYEGTDVAVRRIEGLRFSYTSSRRVDVWRTAWAAGTFLRGMREKVARLARAMESDRPDLVIADFEPLLPRAAKSLGIPFLSLTHQHFLLTYDLRSLPLWLRMHTLYMRGVVAAYYQGQRESVVSSFYFPPLRPGVRGVTQVGVMLRAGIRNNRPADDGHLLVYLRRFAGKGLLTALETTRRPVKVYGLGAHPPHRNLVFREIDESRFLSDLATCSALISTAGNQLVGEALYWRKPVLALPEAGNYEQFINAHFLRQSGGGDWCPLERVDQDVLSLFLRRLGTFRKNIDPERLDGLPATLGVIERFLGKPAVARRSRVEKVPELVAA